MINCYINGYNVYRIKTIFDTHQSLKKMQKQRTTFVNKQVDKNGNRVKAY